MKKRFAFIIPGLAALMLAFMAIVSWAQVSQSDFKIGVLDDERGPISNGARLAVREINARGGIINPDGTRVRLELVIEPTAPDGSLDEAIRRIVQADVNVVLGPKTSDEVIDYMPFLQSLGVPILTPATNDFVVVSDWTQSIFRTRAAEREQGKALAQYLIGELNARQIITVQLDSESISSRLGFTIELVQQGIPPRDTVLRFDEEMGISSLIKQIIEHNPQVVVAYGRPLLASDLYNQLRDTGWVGLFVYNQVSEPAFNENVSLENLHGILSATTWSLDTPTMRSQAFVESYIEGYGEVPGPIDAASYDAVYLLAEAASRSGDLKANLSSVQDLPGVQGQLNPDGLPRNAISDTVAVVRVNALGGPDLIGRYADGQRLEPEDEVVRVTSTPLPTITPDSLYLTIESPAQNVRTGPGLDYPILGQMQQGETARVIGASADFSWVVIEFRGQQGWLASYLLDLSGNRSTVPQIAAPPLPVVPTSTPVPIQIGIQSPVAGNVVSGNTSVIGSALHPQFLQYWLEIAPDPNPQGNWTPLGAFRHIPVLNGFLGSWDTTTTGDGFYQIRLNVTLKDGVTLSTITRNIRVQNRVPTPVPSATPVIPPPVATFSVNQAVGEAPLTVQFTNQSSGNITQTIWHFGDGTTTTQNHPVRTFTAPGVYTVTLEVRGPGGTSNFSQPINVQGPSAPVASFTMDQSSGTVPLTVQFTNQSVNEITGIFWNFGDGSISNQPNPVHTFEEAGIYNVILSVSGPGGTSTATRQIRAANPVVPAPEAQISANVASGIAPLTVQFSSQATGEIERYDWNFGDGTVSTQRNPVHQFTVPGSYTVTLIVSGPGGQDSAQEVITVFSPPTDTPTATSTALPTLTPAPPTATATLTALPTLTPVPPTSTATATSTATPTLTPVPPTTTATLTLTPVPPTATATLTPVPPTATVTATSTATPTLTPEPPTATATATATSTPTLTPVPPTATSTATPTLTPVPPTATATPTVTVEPPVATFTPDVNEGPVPLTVQFTNQSTGEISEILWEFGDGVTSTEINPAYTFDTAGTYPVTLTVSGPGGDSSAQGEITVSEGATATPVPAGPVTTMPVVPDLSSPDSQDRLRAVFDSGLALGNRATVFATAGDDSVAQAGYLQPFADPAAYILDDSSSQLQDIIDWYNQTPLDGTTSFGRSSVATGSGWTVQDLLAPSNSDPNVCEGGETPLVCELRLTRPGVMIIGIGYFDVLEGTNLNPFRNRLQEVVQIALDNGAIPILSTIQPRLDGAFTADQLRAYNEVIIEVAEENQIPLLNVWRAYNELPNSGLDENGIAGSVSPDGPGDLAADAVNAYGLSAQNYYALTTLDDLRNMIFPDAAP